MKIYVRAHDVAVSQPEILAQKVKELRFDGVQLAINKAIPNQTALPGSLTFEFLERIKTSFRSLNLHIPMLGSYFNPIHSKPEMLSMYIEKFKMHLNIAKQLGASYVGSETGSYYSDNQWLYDERNESEEAFQKVKKAFLECANYALTTEAKVAIEGAAHHCIHSPKRLARLLHELPEGSSYAIVDIFNYLTSDNYSQAYQRQLMDECILFIGDKIKIFHLKDFIIENNTFKKVGLGQGLMDLPYIIRNIKDKYPNAIIVFEGVDFPHLKSSLTYIKELLGA